MQFKHCGSGDSGDMWLSADIRFTVQQLVTFNERGRTCPLSLHAALNTCSLSNKCDRRRLPSQTASFPVLVRGGTSRVAALFMQTSLANKHLSWQQRLIKINTCLRETLGGLKLPIKLWRINGVCIIQDRSLIFTVHLAVLFTVQGWGLALPFKVTEL